MRVSQGAAPQFGGRPFTIAANVHLPSSTTSGVLVATGSWFGGWSFYLDHGRPVAIESASTAPQDQFRVQAQSSAPVGDVTIRYEFNPDDAPGSGGALTIFVNGTQVATGHIARCIRQIAGIGETFDIGRDTGEPVTSAYNNEGIFEGQIDKVEVTLGRRRMLATRQPPMTTNPTRANVQYRRRIRSISERL